MISDYDSDEPIDSDEEYFKINEPIDSDEEETTEIIPTVDTKKKKRKKVVMRAFMQCGGACDYITLLNFRLLTLTVTKKIESTSYF